MVHRGRRRRWEHYNGLLVLARSLGRVVIVSLGLNSCLHPLSVKPIVIIEVVVQKVAPVSHGSEQVHLLALLQVVLLHPLIQIESLALT